MPIIEINDFNGLIGNKSFFDLPVKNKQEANGKLIGMSRNDVFTIGNLLDFSYLQNYCKLIGIDLDLLRKTNTSIP